MKQVISKMLFIKYIIINHTCIYSAPNYQYLFFNLTLPTLKLLAFIGTVHSNQPIISVV